MSKRGQSQSGRGEFTHLVDEDLERRKRRREEKLALKSEKGERGLWTQELGETEVGRAVREQAKKEKRTRIAALYSDLRIAYDTGSLTDPGIKDYLKDFPSGAEYQAFEEISEAVRQGKIDKEVQKLQTKIKTGVKSLRHEKVSKRDVAAQKRMKMLAEAVRDRVGRAGPPKNPETGESFFSAEEWREALLREYAAGRLNEEDLQHFFIYYSADNKEAYERLAEEEGINLRESGEKIDWDEIGDRILMSAGFREEFIKDIPTEEGKTIFEEMLEEQIDGFKEILRGTISREDREKKISELGSDKEKAERELVAEAAKKFLAVRELFTHGLLGYDKEKGQMVLGRYSDLDGKCAIALFGKAGIDISRTEYLKPGEYRKGQITVDSGEKDGLVFESAETVDPETGERKKELTTVFDHHGPYSDRGTSATAEVYKIFNELGLLKFEDEKERRAYDRLVEFVTRQDNFDFPEMHGGPKQNNFDKSYRTILGMHKKMSLEKIIQFFKESGKSPMDELEQEELQRYGVLYWNKKTEKWAGTSPECREANEKVLKKAKELASQGFLFSTKDGKKFLIDTTGEAKGEFQWAAASLGYDGIIRYNQDTYGFFIALNKGEFDQKIFEGSPQGKLMRKSMFLQTQGREKLTVALGDLINRLSPGFEPGPRTELKRFLEREPWRIRSIVSRAPEGWWWTNTPSGKKVIVRGLPEGFKSGEEAYLLLEDPRNVREDERRKYGGDFYIGFYEPDKIILPKKPEAKRAPVKAETAPAKPEIRKETPAKVEIKKPAAPEVKVAPKPEIKPAAPKVEKIRTPEERGKIEEEIASGKEILRKQVFEKIMQTLKDSPVWGKRSEEERKSVANNAADLQVKSFEQTKRKEYGI